MPEAPARLSYALGFSRHGARVFPAHWILPDGQCSCGGAKCRDDSKGRGKHPLHSGWRTEATADRQALVMLWGENPFANIGIACGKASNLTVVDVDGQIGIAQLRELENKYGTLPDTPRVITGSGGYHLLFQYEEGLTNAVRWAPGLDIRTEGGLIIGAGSSNSFGPYVFEAGYSLKDLPRAKMPQWLIDVIKQGQGGTNGNGTANGFKVPEQPIIEGEGRNNFLYRAGRSLKAKQFPAEAIRAAIGATNQSRCKPPLGKDEFEALLKSILTQPDSADFKGAQSTSAESDSRNERSTNVPALCPLGTTKEPADGFSFTRVDDLLKEPVESHDYVLNETLIAGGASLMAAKPKVGKSTVARNLARAVSRGNEFLGRATKKGAVVYLELEEKRGQVAGHYRHMGIDGDEPIFIHVGPAPGDALTELRAAIVQHKAVLAVVDPLFKLVRIKDASDYAEVSLKLEPIMVIARETGCHIMLIHHFGKGDRDGGDQILGSTALFAAVDTALFMRKRAHYRTLSSTQRYGVDLTEIALGFDDTGTITCAGSVEDLEDRDVISRIREFMGSHQEWLSQKEIRDGVESATALIVRALYRGVEQDTFARTGEGKRAQPYRYQLAGFDSSHATMNERAQGTDARDREGF